ncbi:Solute carrier family 22 member 6 [Hondaea fermentalgiana]|uniref:Solute carrier family 22 member 6 n=1 Tax=Hondaea fermentalgiana TaxID=2315210 RepID=A0A2R5GM16_9STRA|nr:Solute carrier family 22 member 6 [Hondaea fermentalgiana]|eukprot:GBG29673.1 Solute carrier family 22 member 6 [Hondaea fermentalgiana]
MHSQGSPKAPRRLRHLFAGAGVENDEDSDEDEEDKPMTPLTWSKAAGYGEEREGLLGTKAHARPRVTSGSGGRPSEKTSKTANLRLLDQAIDEIGVGAYQRRLLVLAGFSLFIDVSEGALLSLLYVEFESLWHVAAPDLAVIGAFGALGMMLGSFFWGLLADAFGRRHAFRATLIICVMGGLISSFAGSVLQFAWARLILGFGAGGNLIICQSLLLESSPQRVRGQYVVLSGVSFGVAHLVMVSLAWFLFPRIGWRHMIRFISLLFVPAIAQLAFFVESPRHHIQHGQFHQAVAAVKFIAKANAKTCPSYFNVANLEWSARENATAAKAPRMPWMAQRTRRRKRLLRVRKLGPLLLVWLLMAISSGIFQFLPLELRAYFGGGQAHYLTACVLSLAGLAGTFVNYHVVKQVPRRRAIFCGALSLAVSTLSLCVGRHAGLLFLSVFFMHASFCITVSTLYTYTPESFPTSVRNSVYGLCVGFFRAGAVISPFVASAFISKVPLCATSAFFASISFVAALVALCLQGETLGRPLEEEDEIKDDDDNDENSSRKFGNDDDDDDDNKNHRDLDNSDSFENDRQDLMSI